MGLDVDTLSPVFPPELERAIFEITAHNCPMSIPTLILIAQRVKTWLEPRLYRTIVLAAPTDVYEGHIAGRWKAFTATIQSKPPSFFRESVRNLLLSSSIPPVPPLDVPELILTACSRVENLSIARGFYYYKMPNLLAAIGSLPLKHFCCSLTDLFTGPWNLDFAHPLFSKITHLGVSDYATLENMGDVWFGIALIPHLTHVSFLLFNPSLFSVLLRTCKSLEVLMLVDAYPGGSINDHSVGDLAEDTRFVSLGPRKNWQSIEDWQMGVHTGVDYWSMAEEFIAKR